MSWHRLCETSTLSELPSKGFEVTLADGISELFVVNDNGHFYAYINSCPHTGAPLNWQPDVFLDVQERFVQCAVHGALFNADDGVCIHGPCLGQSLKALPVRQVDGFLEVQLAE